ncbi:MAG: hypothetical protein ABI614_29620, partial [Planctomycetota bacterium]
ANALAAHIATVEGKSLVGQKKFQQVWEKCSVELKGESLALAWYADPWLGIRIRKQENENKDYLFADRHGMTGIVALGGSVVFGDADAQSVKAFAHAPKPLVSSLQMVEQLSGADDLTLPTWVSKAATDIVVLHGSVDKALKHAGRMFDDGFADGVDGTYDEVLSDLKEALDLDLQQELYPLLGPQVYLVHGAAEHRDWQPLVVAFEVKDAARVAEILSALIADDPEASEVVLTRDTDRVWHVPGKRGARDFVLGMLNGVAVYANDLDFAKAALRFDESEALLTREQLLRLRDRAVKDVAGRPSLLIVRNPNSDEPTSTAHPLGLVFEGTQFFADREAHDVGSMQWLPRRLTMMLARHDLVVGFNDEDGWEFAARSGGQLEVSQDDR